MDVFLDSLKVAGFGIAITFIMLFLIIGFIKLLKLLLDLLDKISAAIKRKKNQNTDIVSKENEIEKIPAEPNGMDEEVVAAIIAAICYETGMSSNMFVLKKVRQRRKNIH